MASLFVSGGYGGFEGSLRRSAAVQAPGFIRAEIKNIVSDNQPPDTSVKSLPSILQFFKLTSKI
jgi:hypothetical protein